MTRDDDVLAIVRELRDLAQTNGHQPFVDIAGEPLKMRPTVARRCQIHGPLDGWMMVGLHRIVWCQLCTTFEEASTRLEAALGAA